MKLKTFIKVGNVTNLSDARYCAGMGVNALGFPVTIDMNFDEKSIQFSEIKSWISGVSFVGEFTGLVPEDIKVVLQSFDFDLIEIDNIGFVERLGSLGKPIIFRVYINDIMELKKLKSRISYLSEWVKHIVVRCDNKGLHEDLDLFLRFYEGHVSILKGYGLSLVKVHSLRAYRGIELMASEEERPGYKDYGMVMDILEAMNEE